MNTTEFLKLIDQNPNKELVFQFPNGETIGYNYHITEVKHATINSVDCGGREDSWHETIIQLMEGDTTKQPQKYLTTFKAKGIFNKVNRSFPFVAESQLKFEYGNDHFHTTHLYVNHFETSSSKVFITLNVIATQCKAKDACGIAKEPKIEKLKESCCASNTACC